MQMDMAMKKQKYEEEQKIVEDWERWAVENGTLRDKITVAKNKVTRTYHLALENLGLRRRRLGHLSPAQGAALSALSDRRSQETGEPYNL